MEIKPKYGAGPLLFGMKQTDVEKILGKPNKQFLDEEQNVIYVYYAQKVRLTFYADEDFRLGYFIVSHPDFTLFGQKILGRNVSEVRQELENKGLRSWEKEEFDLAENYFNEENWLILQAEYDEILKIEIGAVIKNADEFDWKFGK